MINFKKVYVWDIKMFSLFSEISTEAFDFITTYIFNENSRESKIIIEHIEKKEKLHELMYPEGLEMLLPMEEYKFRFENWVKLTIEQEEKREFPSKAEFIKNVDFFRKLFFETDSLKREISSNPSFVNETYGESNVPQLWEDYLRNAGVTKQYMEVISHHHQFEEFANISGLKDNKYLEVLHNGKAYGLIDTIAKNPELIYIVRDIFMTAWINYVL